MNRAGVRRPGSSSRFALSRNYVVGGWTPGEGRATELGALVAGVYENGRLRYAGKVGSGFDARTRRDLRARFEKLETDSAPFDPVPPRDHRGRWGGDLRGVVWLKPELVIRASTAKPHRRPVRGVTRIDRGGRRMIAKPNPRSSSIGGARCAH